MPRAPLLGTLSTAVAVAVAGGCDGSGRTRTVEVHHHMAECVGLDYRLCLLVRQPGETDFSFDYDGFRGFEYAWGRRYRIVVTEREVTPVADGSSVRRTLERVTASESAAGEVFDLTLTVSRARVVTLVEGRSWRVYSAPPIACPPDLDCPELAALLASDVRIRIGLRHPADPSDPLIVQSWEELGPAG